MQKSRDGCRGSDVLEIVLARKRNFPIRKRRMRHERDALRSGRLEPPPNMPVSLVVHKNVLWPLKIDDVLLCPVIRRNGAVVIHVFGKEIQDRGDMG